MIRPAGTLEMLRHYGHARNRSVDPDVRDVVLTDDQALELIEYVNSLEGRDRG